MTSSASPHQTVRTLYRDISRHASIQNLQNPSDAINVTNQTSDADGDLPYSYYGVDNYTSRMGSRDNATIVLFILFITFTICLLLMRLSCCYNRIVGETRSGEETTNGSTGGQRNKKPNRTQEMIEKMLVLKEVRVVDTPPDSLDKLEKGLAGRNSTIRIQANGRRIFRRRKSNLLIPSNAADDELDESRTCPICLCNYENGDGICYSHNRKCGHRFHTDCGIAWLAKHDECPLCRAQYLIDPSDQDEVGQSAHSAVDLPPPSETVTQAETNTNVANVHLTANITIIEEESIDIASMGTLVTNQSSSCNSSSAGHEESTLPIVGENEEQDDGSEGVLSTHHSRTDEAALSDDDDGCEQQVRNREESDCPGDVEITTARMMSAIDDDSERDTGVERT